MAGNWSVSGISAQPGETARGLARWPGVGREVPLVLVNGRETAGTVLFCVTSLAINQGDPLFAVGC